MRGEEVSAKTEVKRYIWLNGRECRRVYKEFYIYRIPVVARFLYRGDKRSSSTTDLLGWGVFSDSAAGPALPFPFLIGQFVGVAWVKDVCVIESTHGRINQLAAIIKSNTRGDVYE